MSATAKEAGLPIRYGTIHERIRQANGRASAHACAGCGRRADEWAYDNLDPDELTGETSTGIPVRYSADPGHYRPMCRSCHRSLDSANARKTHCLRGHEFTAVNTYVWRGERHCRTCRRDYHRALRARKKAAS